MTAGGAIPRPFFIMDKPDWKKAQEDRERADRIREGLHDQHVENRRQFDLQVRHNDSWPVREDARYSTKALKYYVKLQEPRLATMVPEAKARAEQARLVGQRRFSAQYKIDFVEVQIEMQNRSCHINVTASDVFVFEFYASGKPLTGAYVGPVQESAGSAYDGVSVVTTVSLAGKAITTNPRLNELRRDSTTADGSTSLINRPRQVQMINEPVAYPLPRKVHGRTVTDTLLFECYDPGSSHAGAYHQSTIGRDGPLDACSNDGDVGILDGRDIDYDLPFGVSTDSANVNLAFFPASGGADWPRSAGLQKVESQQYGTRIFGISIDASDNFIVFPISQIEPFTDWYTQTVDETYVRRISPTYPSWVWSNASSARSIYQSSTVEQLIATKPQRAWMFNSTGTKACTVAHERIPWVNDASYWSVLADANTPWTQAKFDAFCTWIGAESSAPMGGIAYSADSSRYFVAPGLLEATITITLTGPGIDDFAASVNVSALRTPQTTEDYTVLAGYTWYPIADCNGHAVAKDSLVVLDIEYWQEPGVVNALNQHALLISCKTLNPSVELFSLHQNPQFGVAHQIAEWEPKTLSMMFRTRYPRHEARTYTGLYASTTVAEIYDVMVWPIVRGQVESPMFPATMPVEVQTSLATQVSLEGRKALELMTGYSRVPVNPEFDDWVGADIQNYRDWWAFQWHYWTEHFFVMIDPDLAFYGNNAVRYKNDNVNPEPTLSAGGDAMRRMLNAWGWEHTAVMFGQGVKFGWHYYSAWMAQVLGCSMWSSFHVHPNGSWSYFDNSLLYDRNGLPVRWDGQKWVVSDKVDSLSPYDATLVEHVILDRVHFEFSIDEKTVARKDTTFLDLYNRAVRKCKDNPDDTQRFQGSIEELSYTDMRGTFEKNTSPVFNPTAPGQSMLALKCNWNSKTGWLFEQWINDGTGITMFGWGALRAATLYGMWFTTADATGALTAHLFGMGGCRMSEPFAEWHVRFCDPVIIMSR